MINKANSIRSLAQYRGQQCLNCGVPLDHEDKYCHQCGQLNSTKRLSLLDFIKEFISNVFSYDGRGWRTIKHILFKPGYVSKQFIEGKRVTYANPFRFFLSVCIVFFILVQLKQTYDKYLGENSATVDNNGNSQNDINQISENQLREIEEEQIAGKFIADKIREEQSQPSIEENDTLKKRSQEYYSQSQLDRMNAMIRVFKQIDDYSDFYHNERESDPGTALTSLKHRPSNYNKLVYERAVLLESISKDGNILTGIILPKLPIFLFLFTPFVTLFLSLLYIRRSFNYMEHLIFLFNVMTFIFLSSLIIMLLSWATWGYVELTKLFVFIIGPFYLYKSLRNFYGQGRFKTFIKFLLISFVYSISLSVGFSILLLLGIVFY